jgi:hypothetical protein
VVGAWLVCRVGAYMGLAELVCARMGMELLGSAWLGPSLGPVVEHGAGLCRARVVLLAGVGLDLLCWPGLVDEPFQWGHFLCAPVQLSPAHLHNAQWQHDLHPAAQYSRDAWGWDTAAPHGSPLLYKSLAAFLFAFSLVGTRRWRPPLHPGR